MKLLTFAIVLAVFGSTLSDRNICPHPEETDAEVASERISLDAPLAGHSAVELDLSTRVLGRELACFTLITESQNTGPHIVSLGKNFRGGFSVKVYTEERRPLSAFLQAYTPKINPGPNPTPNPGPEPSPSPGPGPQPDSTPQPFPPEPTPPAQQLPIFENRELLDKFIF